jgi:hypothetical protein
MSIFSTSNFPAEVSGKGNEWWAPFRKECGKKLLAGAVGKVEGASVGFENKLGPLDKKAVQLPSGHTFGKSSSQSVQKVEDTSLFLVNLRRRAFQFSNPAS